jgi:hypothetical protein
MLAFLANLKAALENLAATKADADHSHGGSGEVISIGTSDARPAVADGYVHAETDALSGTGQIVMLDAAGGLKNAALMSGGDNTVTGTLSLPVGTAGEHGARVDQLASRQAGFMTVWADYKNSSTVTISAGNVEINGSLYSVDAAFDHVVSPSGDAWYWVMAAEPSSDSALTDTEITSTTTSPTYDAAKDGYYSADGSKRCIGFVLSVSGSLQASRLLNGILSIDSAIEMYSSASWPAAETLITVGPPFRTMVNVTVRLHQTGANAQRNYIFLENGDSLGSVYGEGIGVYYTGSSITDSYFYASAVRSTNSSGQLKTKSTLAQEGSVWLMQIHLPKGFGR